MRAVLARGIILLAILKALPARASYLISPVADAPAVRGVHYARAGGQERPPARGAIEGPLQQLVSAATQIVEDPPGCPQVLFCGCGVSVKVFGHSVRDLW